MVSLITYSGDLPSAPAQVSLVYDGPAGADLLKPKLYALLVGVTGYDNPDYNNIHFSAHDADDLAKALMAQKSGLYRDVQVKIINDRSRPDADPTRSNVENGLYWLQHAATSRDLAVVFLSGHGYLDPKQKFWFLTREADIARLRTTAISNDDLLDLVASIPGKKVLFVDACHSGSAMTLGLKATDTAPDMNKFVNDFSTAGSGVVVFAASTGTELAKEDVKWDSHGAFAKALIDAIGEGKAAIDRSGQITTDMLDYYVRSREGHDWGTSAPGHEPACSCPRFSHRDRAGASMTKPGILFVLAADPIGARGRPADGRLAGDGRPADRTALASGGVRRAVEGQRRCGRDPQKPDRLGAAKAASDGVIAGFTIGLVERYKPERLPPLQANLERAGTGLKEVCDAAVAAGSAAGGSKGIVEDLAKGAVEPVVAALKDGAGALWAHKVEEDKVERDMIKGQLRRQNGLTLGHDRSSEVSDL